MEEMRGQMERSDPETARAKMEEVRRKGEEQLALILTADQMAKYRDWQSQQPGWGRFGGPRGGPR
jgi:hypothetical protein